MPQSVNVGQRGGWRPALAETGFKQKKPSKARLVKVVEGEIKTQI